MKLCGFRHLSLTFLAVVLSVSLLLPACSSRARGTSDKGSAPRPSPHPSPPALASVEKVAEVELPDHDYQMPTYVDGELFLSLGDAATDDIRNLVKYSLADKKYQTIFTSKFKPGAVPAVQANRKWLVWVDCHYVKGGGGSEGATIYVLDRRSGKQKVLSRGAYMPELSLVPEVSLWEDYVAWVEEVVNQGSKVKLCDLRTQKTQLIATSGPGTRIHLADGKLLWTDTQGGGYYRIYDLKKKTTTSISAPYSYPGCARFISSHRIFVFHWPYTTERRSPENQAFGSVDLSSKKFTPFTVGTKEKPGYLWHFDAKDHRLAVIDEGGKLWLYSFDGVQFKEHGFSPPSGYSAHSIDFSPGGELVVGWEKLAGEPPAKTMLTVLRFGPEKINLEPTILPLSKDEQQVYSQYQKKKSDAILEGLSPLTVCKLYFKAEEDQDYQTLYSLYIQDPKYGVPPREQFLREVGTDKAGRENTEKLLKRLKEKLAKVQERRLASDQVVLELTFSDSSEVLGFRLYKNQAGVWKVAWLPMQ